MRRPRRGDIRELPDFAPRPTNACCGAPPRTTVAQPDWPMPTAEQSTSPLGRGRQQAVLQAALEDVAGGWGRIVVIEGEAGIGKTRLLDDATSTAEALGMRLFAGAAEELERERPFGAIADALGLTREADEPDRAEIGGLLSGDTASSGAPAAASGLPWLRFRIVDAITALVERLCAAGPVALALDDLHWADASTLLALHRLVRRLDDLGLAILATCRPTPRSRELTQLMASLREESGRIVRLDPLDDESAASLVAQLVGREPGPELVSEVGGAGGNPLFITELVGALREEDRIKSVDGRAEIEGAALPPSLQLTVLRRLSLLSGDTLDLLRIASVLGSAFSLDDLSVVASRPASDLMPILAPALESAVLGEAGDRLAFRHDLVREAIYEDLPVTARTALHLQAGRALARANAPARQVAVHLAAGASSGDLEAGEWLQRAAGEAAPRDPAIAASFFRRALDIVGDQRPERDTLGAELARSLLWSGRLEEAELVIRELLERPQEPQLAGSLHYALARVLAYRGRLAESIAQVDRALKTPDLPARERASLLAGVSH